MNKKTQSTLGKIFVGGMFLYNAFQIGDIMGIYETKKQERNTFNNVPIQIEYKDINNDSLVDRIITLGDTIVKYPTAVTKFLFPGIKPRKQIQYGFIENDTLTYLTLDQIMKKDYLAPSQDTINQRR